MITEYQTPRIQRHEKLFLSKAVKTPSGCLEWTGYLDKDGYGKFGMWGMWDETHCHRISYKMFKGEIDEGMVVDHVCRNRKCINPDHLRLVTPRQNVLENSNGVAAKNKKKKVCKRGHLLTGENVRIDERGNRWCYECHRERSKLSAKRYYNKNIETLRAKSKKRMRNYRSNNKPK